MRIEIAPGVRLFVDIDGFGLVPDGPAMREKPTLLLLHGGPGFDHAGFKPRSGLPRSGYQEVASCVASSPSRKVRAATAI
jgi:pimeloyl-ACP methyl ester carboxylesterase